MCDLHQAGPIPGTSGIGLSADGHFAIPRRGLRPSRPAHATVNLDVFDRCTQKYRVAKRWPRSKDIWRRGAAKLAPIEPMSQTDEDVFDCDVSDEALEAASGLRAGEITTLMNGSYCFTCAQEGETES
jgi:hypothetical protein